MIILIRPLLRPTDCCKFYPSCSRFAIDQLQTRPLYKALYASARRLMKCYPFSKTCYYPDQDTKNH